MKRLLFNVRREEKTDGSRQTIVETFTDPQGTQAVRTETVLLDGQIKSYRLQQDQTHERGKVDVGGGKVFFEYTDAAGKTKKDEENLENNFVVGITLRNFVKKHWQELLEGKTLGMRLGVPERCETVGFKIFKDKEIERNGAPVEVMELKPSSVIIAAIVKPLFFFFDRSSGSLIQINGRTLPKIKEGNSWNDLDAVTVFDK